MKFTAKDRLWLINFKLKNRQIKLRISILSKLLLKHIIEVNSYEQVKRKLCQTAILRLKFLSKYVIRSLSSYSSKYGSTNVS